jgi:hypothetical protein
MMAFNALTTRPLLACVVVSEIEVDYSLKQISRAISNGAAN